MNVLALGKTGPFLACLLICAVAGPTARANAANGGAATNGIDTASSASVASDVPTIASPADRPAEKLRSIALSPLTFAAAPGATQQLTVTGTYKGGFTRSLNPSRQVFSSSNTGIATVSPEGVVTVVAGALVGATVTIGVTNAVTGISASPRQSTDVTVTTPALDSVSAADATARDNALCAVAIAPFYWEIGDQNGVLASGSVGTSSSGPVLASSVFSIASASKLLYAAYVTQIRGTASNLSPSDINFLHFTSGYTNMDDSTSLSVCPVTLSPDTINKCLTLTSPTGARYSAQDPATVGIFDYNSGHMENHASQETTLGAVGVQSLGPLIYAQLGMGITFNYTEPLMAGGVSTNAATYALVLRNILNGSLAIRDALGTNAVCTLSSSSCVAGFTPFPDEAWHYSIGHWVEDNPATNGDGAFMSGGSLGFYPWIDKTKSYYGIVSHDQNSSGYPTVECGRLIRRAFMTGVEQTGTIPTN
jgi:Bacterial Ig-like domain (group 2)